MPDRDVWSMPTRLLRDYTDSHRVNKLSPEAEVLFIRILMKADDYGRFHGGPHTLAALLFPHKPEIRSTDCSRWIAECEKAGLILTYEARGATYLCVVEFRQQVRSKSKFPPPPEELPDGLQADVNNCLMYAYSEAQAHAEAEAKPDPPPPKRDLKAEKAKALAILEKQR